MRSRRRRASTGTASSNSTQLLALALFIMLLAFFIVLNAISSFEQTKYKTVTASLNQAFSARVKSIDMDENPSIRQDKEENSINEGDVTDRLKALFTAQIPSADVVVNKTRGEMHIRVPFEQIEGAVMSIASGNASGNGQLSGEGRFGGAFFLPALIALMRNDETGRPYRMDMILNIKDNPAALRNSAPQDIIRENKKITDIAERIEGAGLPRRLVSAGLKKGPENMVDLHFRPHVPFDPRADINQAGGAP